MFEEEEGIAMDVFIELRVEAVGVLNTEMVTSELILQFMQLYQF